MAIKKPLKIQSMTPYPRTSRQTVDYLEVITADESLAFYPDDCAAIAEAWSVFVAAYYLMERAVNQSKPRARQKL